MTTRIPSPGKKWAKKKVRLMVSLIHKELTGLDEQGLRAIIKTVEQFDETNCWYYEYCFRDLLIELAKEHIELLKPKKQKSQKNKA